MAKHLQNSLICGAEKYMAPTLLCVLTDWPCRIGPFSHVNRKKLRRQMKCNPEIDKKKRDVMLRLKNGYFCILRSINRMNLLDLSF